MLLGLGEAALQTDHEAEILPHLRARPWDWHRPGATLPPPSAAPRQHVGHAEIGEHRGLARHDLERALIVAARLLVVAQLVERRSLHRKDAPVRIFGRMGLRQHVERLLEIAVVGERAAVSRQAAPCCRDWRWWPAPERRRPARAGRWRAAPGHRRAPRRHPWDWRGSARHNTRLTRCGSASGAASDLAVSEPVTSDMVWQPPRLAANIAVTAAVARNPATGTAAAWCTLTLALDRAERASNKPLTLTTG